MGIFRGFNSRRKRNFSGNVAGIKITFDKSTVVDPITGIITADKPPTFSLSDEEKAALIKELGLTQQFELVDEKSVTAKRPKSIFLAAWINNHGFKT